MNWTPTHWIDVRYEVSDTGPGANNKRSKKVRQSTHDGTVVRVWDALAEAARHGFSQGNIALVCTGQRKHHKGFVWSFV